MTEREGTLSYAGDGSAMPGRFRAPYLVRVWSADRPLSASARLSIAEVDRVSIGRGEHSGHLRSHDGQRATLGIRVADHWMSSQHAELSILEEGWQLRDCDSKNGTYCNGERVRERVLADGDWIHTGNTSFLFRSEVERSHLEAADVGAEELSKLPAVARTLSPNLARSFAELARVARSPVSIILGGETGTGKELSARYVHQASGRAGRFVAINCGALPATLIESELFGHRKGAFSGASSDRQGLVQASDGGTLFLDEIAELPLEAQAKLLRVLQEREVLPLGASRPIPVDLRVVAATHADLEERSQRGLFRSDLLARLAGVSVRLPALHERMEDLGLLTSALLHRHGAGDRCFEREALWALAAYSWPRNIRELEQSLLAAIARAEGDRIGVAHLPAEIREPRSAARDGDAELERRLHQALRAHRGNVSAVARELGKARVQIRRWCKRFGLQPDEYR